MPNAACYLKDFELFN